MSWRTVVISNRCKLDYKMGYLVVRGEETKRVFLEEITMLLIENTAVSLTACLLAEMNRRKIKVIFCDEKRNPMSELVPFYGSHDSSRKIRLQFSWSEEMKGAVWTEIVCEKIRNQANLLKRFDKLREAQLLESYISQMEFFDETNREGHAAKVYFNALFGMDFCRDDAVPINAALNYGYSILLSAFNREIVANGYITQPGLFHGNIFNQFNLSSDLMEPFRILVDRWVYENLPDVFDTEQKHSLLELFNNNVIIDGSRQTVFNAIKIYTKSVFDTLNGLDYSKIKFYNDI